MVKIDSIFRDPVDEALEVDMTKRLGLSNFIPCVHDSPPLIDRKIRLLEEDERVIFIITRSKNSNTVVYRSNSDPTDLIEVFWQKFHEVSDPSADQLTLRKELLWIEKKMAYGVSCKLLPDSKDASVSLVACRDFPMTLVLDRHNNPRIQLIIDGVSCYLHRIYVEANDNFIGIPTVLFTNVHGVEIFSGREIVAKMKP